MKSINLKFYNINNKSKIILKLLKYSDNLYADDARFNIHKNKL